MAMGIPAERIVTGFNAVDVLHFHDTANKLRVGPSPGQYRVIYVGQLIARKNVETALRAWALARHDHDTFTIVGTGPLENHLRAVTHYLGLDGHVHFAGHRDGDDLIAAYAAADTFILPSTEEVWGLVVNEALASGLHAVVSDVAGAAPSVQDMPGVYLAPPTVEGLARALTRSRDEWTGPITNPPILQHTPERLAEAALEAVDIAQRQVRLRRRRARHVTPLSDCAPHLGWLTNIPAPYRIPVWQELTKRVPTSFYALASSEPGREWAIEPTGVDLHVLGAKQRLIGARVWYPKSRRVVDALAHRPLRALVLDGWESPAFQQARRLAERLDVPIIASYRSTLESHTFNRGPVPWQRRRFFQAVDAIMTAGPASTAAVLAMGVPEERIVTGFNAVDVLHFYDTANEFRTAAAPGQHRVIYVGQLIARKNVETALRAWATARHDYDTFTIVGTGPLENQLRAVTHELRLDQHVHFAGHLDGDQLIAAYAAADTFILPSTEEVWGLVVNEALASGLHAVVSDVAGAAPSVQDMPGVYLAPPTVEGLAHVLTRSRDEWTGPIENPPILEHTPEKLAETVLHAIEIATRVRSERRTR